MRLLHVIEGLHPDRGGPPQVAVALAEAQRAAGHEVAFASHDADASEAVGLLDSHGLAGCGRRTVRPCGPLGDAAFAAAVAELDRPDAMQLHGVWNSILPQAARWARRRGIPYAITTHGALHPFPMARGRWKKRIALATTHRAMLRGAAGVFTLNDEERDAIATIVGPVAETLANGVGPCPPLEASGEGGGGRPYLVFLGRIDWTKGLESLVDAHRRMVDLGADVDLVLVGNDWGSRPSVEAAIAAAGTADRVRFVGPRYGDAKRRILAEAELFVHLPRYEGFGMAVLEALAAGTPAVIGDRCLLPGAGPAIGVVVSPSDPSTFARIVTDLLADPVRRDELSRAGRRAVAERFRWSDIAARCVEVLATARGGR